MRFCDARAALVLGSEPGCQLGLIEAVYDVAALLGWRLCTLIGMESEAVRVDASISLEASSYPNGVDFSPLQRERVG